MPKAHSTGLQQNRNATWTAVIRSKKHGYISRTFQTKKDAREWREETLSDLRRGRRFIVNGELLDEKQKSSGGMTFAAACIAYQDEPDCKAALSAMRRAPQLGQNPALLGSLRGVCLYFQHGVSCRRGSPLTC